jgi:ribosome-associated translation inhibitor RaiA
MPTANILKADSPAFIELQDLPDSIGKNIQEQITRLCQEYPQTIDCKVSVKTPTFCKEGCYQIELAIVLSGRILTIERSPNLDCYQEDLYVAIWSAFNLAKKQLKEHLSQAANAISQSVNKDSSPAPSIYPLRRCIGYAGG